MSSDRNAGSDEAANQEKAPVNPDKVIVKVRPRIEDLPKKDHPKREAIQEQNERNKQQADKAADTATKKVREAVRDASSGGRKAQVDAAAKEADRAAEALPGGAIRDITVDIPGETPIVREAKEGSPPTPAPAKP